MLTPKVVCTKEEAPHVEAEEEEEVRSKVQ